MRYRSGGFGPPDGPDDLWQRAADRDREVLATAAFPLYAPVAPELEPHALTEYQLGNGRLVKVTLSAGDWLAQDGPRVQVTTVSETDPGVTEVWASLADLLADERDRVRALPGVAAAAGAAASGAAASGAAESGAAEPGVIFEGESQLLVDGASVPATLRREGLLWVARLRPAGAAVTLAVTGRGVAPDAVELGVVADTAPYALGRQQLLNQLMLRRQRQEKRQEPGGADSAEPRPLGLDDHRQLVDFCIADALRVEAAVRAHRPPGPGLEPEGTDRRTLWDRAVRQQMRLAGEDRQEADESVTALVTQMQALAQAADWFADPAAGTAAVEESIRFTALASEVRSAPAQRAWLRQWQRLDDLPLPGDPRPTPEEARLRHELTMQARAGWLDLWRVWFSGR